MKKRIRFLSLFLSLVLLFTAAVPAFAAEYNPYYDIVAENTIDLNINVPRDLYFDAGNYTYDLEMVPKADDISYHHFIEEAYYHPYFSEDIVLEDWVDAEIKTWESQGWFDSQHVANIEAAIAEHGITIAQEVSNRDLYYSFELNGSFREDYYAVILTCQHYMVATTASLRNSPDIILSIQTLTNVPCVDGDFIYLDCSDLE